MVKYYLEGEKNIICVVEGPIPKGYQEIIMNGINYTDYCKEIDRYEIQDGIVYDISHTTPYIEAKKLEQKKERMAKVKQLLADLDLKSIRALREGGVADNSTKTYLEMYQTQIDALREEYNTLESEGINV